MKHISLRLIIVIIHLVIHLYVSYVFFLSGKQNIEFRVQIIDLIYDEVLYEKTMTTPGSSRGDTLNELAKLGLEARSKYAAQNSHKLDRVNEITEITKQVLLLAGAHIKASYAYH